MVIDPRGEKTFYEVGELLNGHLKDTASKCISAQRTAAGDTVTASRARDSARAAVSTEALDRILSSGNDIHGISADPGIADVVTFNTEQLKDSIASEAVAELRQALDDEVARILRRAFRNGSRMRIACSGHFWYPSGSYMGWHTNNRAPGWRVYLTHATEPGRSFFRYRDPGTGEVITSMDREWDLRIFRVDPAAPLWHAVYSDTDRFSFGYIVIEKTLVRSFLGRARAFISRAPDSASAHRAR